MDISLSLDTTEFLDKNMCINGPPWESSGIIIFLCEYYFRHNGRLFMDDFFLLLPVILSVLWKTKQK